MGTQQKEQSTTKRKKKLSNRLKLFSDVSRYFDRFGHLIFSF